MSVVSTISMRVEQLIPSDLLAYSLNYICHLFHQEMMKNTVEILVARH